MTTMYLLREACRAGSALLFFGVSGVRKPLPPSSSVFFVDLSGVRRVGSSGWRTERGYELQRPPLQVSISAAAVV